jgi:EpsI family protein
MSVARRDLLIGALCAGALGTAEWLRPRRQLLLLPAGTTLAQLVPERFSGWREDQGGGVVTPTTEGSLADRLYDEQLIRSYASADAASSIMLLATYGRSQSDGLQLHRPESCYPAVGFAIVERRLSQLVVAPGASIATVSLSARLGDRHEDIVYWTRLGEALPQTAGDQRSARLAAAMAGYVGDGVLLRASAVRVDEVPQFDRISRFLRDLVLAVAPDKRAALIGTEPARTLAGIAARR